MPGQSDATPWRGARIRRRAAAADALPIEEMAEPAGKRGRAKPDAAPAVSVEEALGEITTIAAVALHRQAAHTWAARAVACYRVCLAKRDLQEGLSYLYLAEHYREAALAHAAFGESWQPLRSEIEAVMDADRADASSAMRHRSLADPRVTR